MFLSRVTQMRYSGAFAFANKLRASCAFTVVCLNTSLLASGLRFPRNYFSVLFSLWTSRCVVLHFFPFLLFFRTALRLRVNRPFSHHLSSCPTLLLAAYQLAASHFYGLGFQQLVSQSIDDSSDVRLRNRIFVRGLRLQQHIWLWIRLWLWKLHRR